MITSSHKQQPPPKSKSEIFVLMSCIAIVCGPTVVHVCHVMYMLICKPKPIGLKAYMCNWNILCMSQVLDLSSVPFRRENSLTR